MRDTRTRGAPGIFHCVFSTYQRKLALADETGVRMKSILAEIIARNGYDVLCLSIVPDHVHVLIRTLPGDSIAWEINMLKGASARRFFQEFPEVKFDLGVPHLWASSFYERQCSEDDLSTIIDYILNQEEHHGWTEQ